MPGLSADALADFARDHPPVVASLREGKGLEEIRAVEGGRDFGEALERFLDDYGFQGPAEIDLIRVQGYGKRGVRKGTVVEPRKGVEREVLVVRWEDGHTSTFIPGAGTIIEHEGHDSTKR